MSNFNQAIIVGRLGRDPEMRYSADGVAFVTVSVATSETWKDKQTGEKKERTDWHRVKASGRTAEVIGEYLKKGSLALFSGRLRNDKFTDKEGVERYDYYLRVDTMQMLGGKPADGERAQRDAQPPVEDAPRGGGSDDFDDSDIPF